MTSRFIKVLKVLQTTLGEHFYPTSIELEEDGGRRPQLVSLLGVAGVAAFKSGSPERK